MNKTFSVLPFTFVLVSWGGDGAVDSAGIDQSRENTRATIPAIAIDHFLFNKPAIQTLLHRIINEITTRTIIVNWSSIAIALRALAKPIELMTTARTNTSKTGMIF
jgi:hypothetical protein